MFPNLGDSFLIRHPNFMRVLASTNIVVSGIFAYVFFFILPLVLPLDQLLLLVRIGMTLVAFFVGVFLISILAVGRILLKMFASFSNLNKMARSSHGANIPASKTIQRFTQARITVYTVMVLGVTFGPSVLTLLCVMAWYGPIFSYFYVFICLLTSCADLVVILLSYILVYRMGQENGPAKKVYFYFCFLFFCSL